MKPQCMHADDQEEDEALPVKASPKQKKRRRKASQGRRRVGMPGNAAAGEDSDDEDMHAVKNENNDGTGEGGSNGTNTVNNTSSSQQSQGKRTRGASGKDSNRATRMSGDGSVGMDDYDPESDDLDAENGDNSTEGLEAAVEEPKPANKFKRQVGNNRLGGKSRDDGSSGGKGRKTNAWCTQVCFLAC